MSFLRSGNQSLTYTIKSGYTFTPRTFTYSHLIDGEYVPDENDGWEAQLEVLCSKDGEPVFVANSEDSGSGLTIDPDEIIIEFGLDPDQTAALDFVCCNFVLFIYKGTVYTIMMMNRNRLIVITTV